MNILYGVSGVGYGHSSRAALIVKHLEDLGHIVKILTYGDGYEALKDRFDCHKVEGLEIVFENGEVKKRKTFAKNAKIISKNIKLNKYKSLVENFKPQVCITDMESTVYRISKKFDIPLISIDNQHRLTNLKVDIPIENLKDFLITKGVIKGIVRKADKFIISSFSKMPLRKKNSVIVPPIIRNEVQKLKKGNYSGKVLVYISRGDKKIAEELKKIDENFVVFGLDEQKNEGNLEFKKKESFLKELERCKCIVATAGFSLISEALYLNKPYFALPLKGQFEQVFNAIVIKKSGYGDYSKEIDAKEIEEFLKNLETYKKNIEAFEFRGDEIFEVLDREIERLVK